MGNGRAALHRRTRCARRNAVRASGRDQARRTCAANPRGVCRSLRPVAQSRQRARALTAVLQHLSGVHLAAEHLPRARSARCCDGAGRRAGRRADSRPVDRAQRGTDRVVPRGHLQPAGVERGGHPLGLAPARRSARLRASTGSRPLAGETARAGAIGRWHVVRRRELSPVRAPGPLVRNAIARGRWTVAASSACRSLRRGICDTVSRSAPR